MDKNKLKGKPDLRTINCYTCKSGRQEVIGVTKEYMLLRCSQCGSLSYLDLIDLKIKKTKRPDVNYTG